MDLVLCDPAAIKFVGLNEKKNSSLLSPVVIFSLSLSLAEIEQLVKEAKAGELKETE